LGGWGLFLELTVKLGFKSSEAEEGIRTGYFKELREWNKVLVLQE